MDLEQKKKRDALIVKFPVNGFRPYGARAIIIHAIFFKLVYLMGSARLFVTLLKLYHNLLDIIDLRLVLKLPNVIV